MYGMANTPGSPAFECTAEDIGEFVRCLDCYLSMAIAEALLRQPHSGDCDDGRGGDGIDALTGNCSTD
jgi:hypothetical protein